MADLILGNRFESRGKSAWHNKGNVFPIDDAVTLIQAAERVANDIRVYLCDEGIHLPDGTVYGDSTSKAVMRAPIPEDPSWVKFGTVEGNWKTRQYIDYAALLNDLSSRWPVETAGVIKEGRQFWFALNMGKAFARAQGKPEEEFECYIIGLFSQDPGVGHKIYVTQVRPVCSNTLTMGWSSALASMIVDHRDDAEQAFRWMSHVARHAQAMQTHMTTAWEMFMATPLLVGSPEFKALLNDAFPMPAPSQRMRHAEALGAEGIARATAQDLAIIDAHAKRYDKTCEFTRMLHDSAHILAQKFNDEHSAFANTAWCAWNAVTELSDHRAKQSREDVGVSVLCGNRFMEKGRAYSNLATLCNVPEYAAN